MTKGLVYLEGSLPHLRWTWLPYWISCRPDVVDEITRNVLGVYDASGDPKEQLESLSKAVILYLCTKYPDADGLDEVLYAIDRLRQ